MIILLIIWNIALTALSIGLLLKCNSLQSQVSYLNIKKWVEDDYPVTKPKENSS